MPGGSRLNDDAGQADRPAGDRPGTTALGRAGRPFEHIYRYHRRRRITEGAEEIKMRRVAGYPFGFIKPDTLKGVTG
jgi:hypothetical protein